MGIVARIAGGAMAGWLLSLAPLIVVNALSLTNGAVDPSSTALAGAGALALGIALGGLAAGLIGGRRGGAIAGAIAGALYAASLIGLMYALRAQGNLPNLVASASRPNDGRADLYRRAGRGCGDWNRPADGAAARFRALAPPRGSAPRSQVSGPRQPAPSWHGPQGRPANGASQPRPGARELTPARRMDEGWPPDPRRAPPGSGPRQAPSQPPRRPAMTPRDEQGHWPDAPGRW